MMIRQPPIAALAIAGACVLGVAVAARAPEPARVSGPTPFAADCNGPTFPGGAAYVNAEVEPRLAVNPRDPKNLIAVYQQDRYPDDGANGVLAAYSVDGGRSWQRPALALQPAFSRCAGGTAASGGDLELASDPWVDFGPDGTAYFAALGFNKSNADTAEFVAVSTDGGRRWQAPVSVIRENIANVSDERPAVTADPARARTAYLVWARHRTAPAEEARGAVYFSRTIDGGGHWSAPRAIYEAPLGMQTSANQVVVTPGGELVDVFNELGLETSSKHPRHDRIAAIRSSDGGETWSAPVTVATSTVAAVADPRTNQPVRAGDSFTAIAVDARAGTSAIYAAWADARFTDGRRQQIVVARSGDGGVSWSEPVAIDAHQATSAFVPSIAVNERGEVAVAYFELVATPAAAPAAARTLPARYAVVRSTDGGRSWSAPRPLADPFDLRTAPFNGGFFLGEYQGLAAAGTRFVGVAALPNGHRLDDRTDVYLLAAPAGN
jgi:hypothetical protein